MAQSSYNPLAAHAATIRIDTSDIFDPVKRDVLRTEREKALMAGPGALRTGCVKKLK